ncbi:MAG: DKNYY domain-containing protein [Gammaproteobacteria bacterium]
MKSKPESPVMKKMGRSNRGGNECGGNSPLPSSVIRQRSKRFNTLSLLFFVPTISMAACDNFVIDALVSIDRYSVEKNVVYYCSGNGWIGKRHVLELAGVDVATFKILEYGYARDKSHIYFKGQRQDYDINSFLLLSSDYVKDQSGVFFQGQPFECDTRTFKVIDGKHAIDKNHLYVIVTGVDNTGAMHDC